MISLNFDSDTVMYAINIFKILSLWNKKMGDLTLDPLLLNVNYSGDYEELLYFLLNESITSKEVIYLEKDNCDLAYEILEFNDEFYFNMLDWYLDDPYDETCNKCNQVENDCSECDTFNDFLESYSFRKLIIKSKLIDGGLINPRIADLLGMLVYNRIRPEYTAYVSSIYNSVDDTIEIMFFEYDHYDDCYLSNHECENVALYFTRVLNDM